MGRADLELEVGGGRRAVKEATLWVEALVSAVGQNPLNELDCAGGYGGKLRLRREFQNGVGSADR